MTFEQRFKRREGDSRTGIWQKSILNEGNSQWLGLESSDGVQQGDQEGDYCKIMRGHKPTDAVGMQRPRKQNWQDLVVSACTWDA